MSCLLTVYLLFEDASAGHLEITPMFASRCFFGIERSKVKVAGLRQFCVETERELYAAAAAARAEGMREAQSQNKDLSRQVQELMAIRHQLEADRDRLATELNDANEALRDAQARLDAANAALSQLKIDFEHRLREKDEEIENIRSVLGILRR